ncbi:hypothetical protein ACJIZ3_012622 [Penstemon smallii]|uniref:Uncharacterized protein n=1 Tax=Penstemon smallii TaxID=265156 RepID=A0ABD3UNV1_9LAMI
MNKFIQILRKASTSSRNHSRVSSIHPNRLFFSNQIHSQSPHSRSFGIAFDIDGVLLRGDSPIGGSPQALRRLYDRSGNLRVPYVFLTNGNLYATYTYSFKVPTGGGVPESERATDLTKLLSVDVLASQVIQGHSPFKQLVNRFENELIIAVGKGEPASVMSEYGFKNVLSMDEYASYFENIDPLGQYKSWIKKQADNKQRSSRDIAMGNDPCSQRVQAVFIVSDSVDWSRDIQVFLYLHHLLSIRLLVPIMFMQKKKGFQHRSTSAQPIFSCLWTSEHMLFTCRVNLLSHVHVTVTL